MLSTKSADEKQQKENEQVYEEELIGKRRPDEPTQKEFNIVQSKITDKTLIAKYSREFDFNFFMPTQEEDTFDIEELMDKNYAKSAEKIGGQIHPIAVSVCPEDPTMQDGEPLYNPESMFRIHGRISDGRHRYLEVKTEGKTWDVDYYYCRNFDEFMQLRAHMDSKKKHNQDEMSNRFQQIAEYKYKILGIPRDKICALLIKEYCPPHGESSIRNWLPKEYKDKSFADRRIGKTKNVLETVAGKKIVKKVEKKMEKQLSKKDKRIQTLVQKADADIREISTLRENQAVLEEKVHDYDELKPFLTNMHRTRIEDTDIEVIVELSPSTKSVKVTKFEPTN